MKRVNKWSWYIEKSFYKYVDNWVLTNCHQINPFIAEAGIFLDSHVNTCIYQNPWQRPSQEKKFRKYIKYSPGLINQDVTVQPRINDNQSPFVYADFLFPAKTPQTQGFQISHFHRKIASYRFVVVTQNGIRVGSNLHECSRIRNFGAKCIWFVSRLTEYRLHLYNTFA